MIKKRIFLSKSEQDTIDFGKKVACQCAGGEIFGLIGELGAGKTTFIKGAAKGLGIKDEIISPSFVLRKEYEFKKEGIKRLIHIDLYRLAKQSGEELEFFEDVGEKQTITFIEWPKQIKFNKVKGKKYYITFIIKNNNTRTIKIEKLC